MRHETETKYDILRAAIKLARARGFRKFLRRDVATEAGIATGTVSYHYGDMSDLRIAVMQYAVENEVLDVIAQGLAERHAVALKAPEVLRRKAARCLAV